MGVLYRVLDRAANATRALNLDLQRAVARAGLGERAQALASLDARLARFAVSERPLVLGLLYDTRARIAWDAGLVDDYKRSWHAMQSWFRPTQNPILIARCEEVGRLDAEAQSAERLARSTGETPVVTHTQREELATQTELLEAGTERTQS